jgi:hypothetical protein
LIAGNLYNLGEDRILRRCVLENERSIIMEEVYDGIIGGNYLGKDTAKNILCAGLWWPTLNKM